MSDPVYRLKKQASPPENDYSFSRLKTFGTFVTVLLVGLVFLRTVTPGMQQGDGTELATAAYTLGVPHPTGYPLYMLLSKIWIMWTGFLIREPILQTTIFSAVCIAVACGLVFRMLLDFFVNKWQETPLKYLVVICVSAAISCGLLRYHWSNAVVTEVYGFQFLIMIAFFRVIQLAQSGIRKNHIIMAGVLLAMGIAHHRMSIVLIPPYFYFIYLSLRQKESVNISIRTVLSSCAIILLGAALYLYIPMRAVANPPVNWGAVNSVQRFFDHVEGKMYLEQSFMRSGRGQQFGGDYLRFLGKMTSQMIAHFVEQVFPVTNPTDKYVFYNRYFVSPLGYVWIMFAGLASIAALGCVKIYQSYRHFFLIISLAALGNIAVLFVYNIRDIFDYYLFPFWFGWFLVLIGGIALFYKYVLKSYPVLSYGFVLLPLWLGAVNWTHCDRSNDVLAEVLSEVILPNDFTKVPKNSIIITGADTDTFTMWYRQAVRKERGDVFVFLGNFIWQDWYADTISKENKDKYRLKFAKGVARDPGEYVEQIDQGVIAENIDKTSIFTSIEDVNVLKILEKKYSVKIVDSATANDSANSPVAFSLYKIEKK